MGGNMFELFNWVWNMLILAIGTIGFSFGLFFLLMMVFMIRDIFFRESNG